MLCFSCRCSFPDNSTLIKHISRLHTDLTVYKCCGDENCYRSFSSLRSFIKHRNSKHAFGLGIFSDDHSSDDNSNYENSVAPALPTGNSECTNDLTCSMNDLDNEHHQHSENDTNENIIDVDEDRDDIELIEKLKKIDRDEYEIPNAEFVPNASIFNNVLKQKALRFVAKLYDYPEIPRSRVQDIVEQTSEFVNSIVNMIRETIQVHLKPTDEDPERLLEVQNIFDSFAMPFENLETEWNRFSNFMQHETLILPEQFTIGEREEFKDENGIQKLYHVKVTAQFIPIRKVFQIFFQSPGVFQQTLDYLNYLQSESDVISNFVQGSLWKSKSSTFGEKIVLPLFMYFDDYETNNPLGSHKGISKCGAVYLSIPCLPPDFQSKLENIFLFILFNTLDREIFKNEIIFSRVIKEFEFLENEGITVNLDSGSIQVFFSLALILGDNLGVHSILGFSESFQANFFCRFCLTLRNNIGNIFHERQCVIRDCLNYEQHVQLNDLRNTGIKEECVFNTIPSFHPTKNISADVMHDKLEGTCPYDCAEVFHHFVYVLKLFSLDELNDKIRGFHYGPNDNKNKPAEITEHHLKKNKRLAMSSAEMLCLVRNVCTILGDLVPEDNEHWLLLKLMKKIIDIVTSMVVTSNTHNYLGVLITEYLQLHVKLFPGSMKPKHHFLVHYPRILETVGVLWKICSMRYESKHREGKIISHAAVSRVNVCRTIALRHQLRLNYRFLCKSKSYPPFVMGPRKLGDLNNEVGMIKNILNMISFPDILPRDLNDHMHLASWVKYRGDKIKKNTIVMVHSEEGPIFYSVQSIIVDDKYKFVLVTKELLDCYFNEHKQAYKILNIDCFDYKSLLYEDLQNAVITWANRCSDGFFYISKKWM